MTERTEDLQEQVEQLRRMCSELQRRVEIASRPESESERAMRQLQQQTVTQMRQLRHRLLLEESALPLAELEGHVVAMTVRQLLITDLEKLSIGELADVLTCLAALKQLTVK